MVRVLIYKSKDDLKPIGGPNGYLFNLHDGLLKVSDNEVKIDFCQVVKVILSRHI